MSDLEDYSGEVKTENPKGLGDYILELKLDNVKYRKVLEFISLKHKSSSNPHKNKCAIGCPACVAIEALKEVTDEKG